MRHDYTDEAVGLAIQGRWEEALAVNESMIELSPSNTNAYNRLGKAFTELGNYTKAKEAYEHVLVLDPNNNIAKRNLERLSYLKDDGQLVRQDRSIDFKLFIEETGKARMVNLYRTASRETLAKMSTGTQVYLQIMKERLVVVSDSEEYLGETGPRIGLRLIERIRGGNEYQAAIAALVDDDIRVIIREKFQHPSQLGHPSFPPKTIEEPKPYLKNTLGKYDFDSDIFEESEEAEETEETAEAEESSVP